MNRNISILAITIFSWSATVAQQIDKQAYVANYNAIMRARDADKAEHLFQELLKNFGVYTANLPAVNRDGPISAVAYAFIKEKDTLKADQYIGKLSNIPTIPGELYGLSKVAQSQGLDLYAERLMKKAVARYESLDLKPDPKADPLGLINNRQKYGVLFYTEYAQLLSKNGKEKLGLEFAKKAYQVNSRDRMSITTYARLLEENKLFEQALPVMEEGIRSGAADSTLLARYRNTYLILKGGKSYPGRLSALQAEQARNTKKEMQNQMISEVAPNFNLKDLDGHNWTLEALKGKTVVIDFWATWCAPCKKSFPAMQKALKKYKKDSGVIFLFIHTWERQAGAENDARHYITNNHYDFTVLMDLKSDGKNPAITAYKASGIPAKFVIDGKGNIRFKLTGFAGSDEAAVSELSAMIELAKAAS